MSTISTHLVLISARFPEGANRKMVIEGAPAEFPAWFAGTDAEILESGMLERRRTECHWLSAWTNESEVDSFLSAPTTHVPALGIASELWRLKLVPYMQRGAEILPLAPHDTRPRSDEPIVIITTIGPYSREEDALTAFQRAHCSRSSLLQAEGLLHEMLLVPYPPMATDLFTITIWRNERAAQTWAYRTDSHRAAMEFYKAGSEKPRVSFTRCLIERSEGGWRGREPALLIGDESR
ncbi:MAG: hypothetical protein Q8O29_00910 [Polaromonas sp.]|uniref:hypothetical protein n=1 Tax=Polaromonas sp. TaxID=1869339 RepID=UPI00273434A6|nr:hypothetical protein [Polaromonas sp.]MDP2816839.1 hypothetical protein [Polaromonas sp.]